MQQSGEMLYVKLLHFEFCSQPDSNGKVYLCDLGMTYHRSARRQASALSPCCRFMRQHPYCGQADN